jgi:hypothetical protein
MAPRHSTREPPCVRVDMGDGSVTLTREYYEPRRFRFDRVLGEGSTQAEVYAAVATRVGLLEGVMAGATALTHAHTRTRTHARTHTYSCLHLCCLCCFTMSGDITSRANAETLCPPALRALRPPQCLTDRDWPTCRAGINATIIAYGQSGSGKSFTMLGGAAGWEGGVGAHHADGYASARAGLLPRAVADVFGRIGDACGGGRARAAVSVSFVQARGRTCRAHAAAVLRVCVRVRVRCACLVFHRVPISLTCSKLQRLNAVGSSGWG